MSRRCAISVVIPVLDEEHNITPLCSRLQSVLSLITEDYELVFVNDGSKDLTLINIIAQSQADSRIHYIDLSRNFGHQIAVSAGIDHAAGDAVVVIDADLQDPPELIPAMYQRLQEGYEVVYAVRVKRKGETLFKRFSSHAFYRLLNRLTSFYIPVDTGDFRIFDKKVADVLRQMPERHKFLRGQISWAGFRQSAIEYVRDPRLTGKTKYPFRRMVGLALDGITGFSTLPLKFVTYLGFISSGLAFILILWVIYVRLWGVNHGMEVQLGWASQMITILFMGGIQLIGMGILGEYIGRISEDIKNRPLYVIRQKSQDL